MKKDNLVFLSLIAVAFIITVPYAYSAVEPSIIINMESGQTLKPIQIKDNLGAEVFSIDVDGTIFPAVVTGTLPTALNVTAINFDSASFAIGTGNISSAPLILWQVDVNENADPNTWTTPIVHDFFNGQALRTAGAGTCTIGIAESSDNTTTWTIVFPISISVNAVSTEEVFNELNDPVVMPNDITNFGLIAYNSNGSTSCDITDFSNTLDFFEVPVYTYTQVLP